MKNTPRPQYSEMKQLVPSICQNIISETNWYPPVMLNAASIADRMFSDNYIQAASDLYQRLTPDEYVLYLKQYYTEGLQRFGKQWKYADIVTALLALADVLQPSNYLEIGVRRGRSVAAVITRKPDTDCYLFDMWTNKRYAGMDNPGHEFVEEELVRLGHKGKRNFVIGNSHDTLPKFFAENPNLAFDMITVDGDHTDIGARQDLSDILSHLKLGGAVVFDDICHPKHPHLREVWRDLVENDPRFSVFSLDDIGYGIGFGIRLW